MSQFSPLRPTYHVSPIFRFLNQVQFFLSHLQQSCLRAHLAFSPEMQYCRCSCCGKLRRTPRTTQTSVSPHAQRRICSSRPSTSCQTNIAYRDIALPNPATEYAASVQRQPHPAHARPYNHSRANQQLWVQSDSSSSSCTATTSSTSTLCETSDPSSSSRSWSSTESSEEGKETEQDPDSTPSHLQWLVRVDPETVPPLPAQFFQNPNHRGRVFHVSMVPTGDDGATPVVVKWPACGGCPTRLTELSRTIADLAARFVDAFVSAVNTREWRIFVNYPLPLPQCPKTVLVERAVHNFDKFNSNSGWAKPSKRTFSRLLQALSHFSYFASSGQRLLCNLQGGVYMDKKIVILTNPAIISQKSSFYGCSDLGEGGMEDFLKWHKCNKFCAQFLTKEGPDRDTIFNAPVAPHSSQE